jgi:hypothetical protein
VPNPLIFTANILGQMGLFGDARRNDVRNIRRRETGRKTRSRKKRHKDREAHRGSRPSLFLVVM